MAVVDDVPHVPHPAPVSAAAKSAPATAANNNQIPPPGGPATQENLVIPSVLRLKNVEIETYDDGGSWRSDNSEANAVDALDAEGDGDMGTLLNHAKRLRSALFETGAELASLCLIAMPLPKRSSLPKLDVTQNFTVTEEQ